MDKLPILIISLLVSLAALNLAKAEVNIYKLDSAYLSGIRHKLANFNELEKCARFYQALDDTLNSREVIFLKNVDLERLINQADVKLLTQLALIMKSRKSNSNVALFLNNCAELITNHKRLVEAKRENLRLEWSINGMKEKLDDLRIGFNDMIGYKLGAVLRDNCKLEGNDLRMTLSIFSQQLIDAESKRKSLLLQLEDNKSIGANYKEELDRVKSYID